MKQSKYFAKTLRNRPKDEPSINAQLLGRGAFTDKLLAGIYTFLPLGLRVLKKIEKNIRSEMNAVGGQEIFMPALHPIENYAQTGRDKIDVLFHLISASGKEMVLGQSHEEVVVPLAKKFIDSYKDLPLYLYQIQVKFRNELRAKSGLLRGREFMMKDLYSFHKDKKDFDIFYEVMKKAYHNIFTAVGIGDITYLTFASGGTFSKYSHEFQTITTAGEDIIHICDQCKIAVNDDLIKEQKSCPNCANQKLTPQKGIEVGNIFPLKTKFSDAFDLKYTDKNGGKQPVIMGCYGIGLGRVMGAIVEVHHDQQGIIWPKSVTPFEVHLLCLSNDSATNQQADKLYSTLQKEGVDVLYDDRNVSAGVKLKDADLYGITVRLIISDKTGSKIELKYRNQKQSRLISLNNLIKEIKRYYS